MHKIKITMKIIGMNSWIVLKFSIFFLFCYKQLLFIIVYDYDK